MHLFDYDSGFSLLIRRAAGCLLLGCLWLVCCIPIITFGAGSAALYYAVEKAVIREEGHLFSCFWRSFQESFKTATCAWLAALALGLFLGWDFYFFFQMLRRGNPEGMLCVVVGIMLVLLALTVVYAFSYIARFQDKVGRVLKNSLLLMLAHPLVNLKLVVIGAILALTALIYPPLVLLLPGFLCWLICLSMEKIFRRISETLPISEDDETTEG